MEGGWECQASSHAHSRRVGDARGGIKVGQIGPKWDKSGTYPDKLLVHFGAALKSDLKSPGFVLFGANLTHFGSNSGHPGSYLTP